MRCCCCLLACVITLVRARAAQWVGHTRRLSLVKPCARTSVQYARAAAAKREATSLEKCKRACVLVCRPLASLPPPPPQFTHSTASKPRCPDHHRARGHWPSLNSICPPEPVEAHNPHAWCPCSHPVQCVAMPARGGSSRACAAAAEGADELRAALADLQQQCAALALAAAPDTPPPADAAPAAALGRDTAACASRQQAPPPPPTPHELAAARHRLYLAGACRRVCAPGCCRRCRH
jgi:hypothetical protein